jgi:oligogalacturonide lyase
MKMKFSLNPLAVVLTAICLIHFPARAAETTVADTNAASLSVQATGTALAYQWYNTNVDLVAGTNLNLLVQPTDWVDADTGHRVVQLSTEPGSESLYFNLNPFTPDGKRMVFTTPSGISMINLQTREVEKIVEGRVHIIMVGHKTGQIYYILNKIENGVTNHVVCATDPKTKATREILTLARGQSVATVNADETLLGGTFTERTDWTNAFFDGGPNRLTDVQTADEQRARKGTMMEQRLAKRYPMELFFYNIATGKTKKVNRCTDWLNHLQFSPTDPNLLMFCHEGAWHKVDRIWTIRTDGSHLKLIHQRTMAMEIAGHEFWSADGKTIWYDLQTPRGEDFWVAAYGVTNGARTWYHLQRNEWGVHFNVSPDNTLFSSDGGDSHMVAHAPDGAWLNLFYPELLRDSSGPELDSDKLIKPGVFHSERLVNMSKHDYALEPNGMFSPDMKWLIFRSNMSGANQVYAVELKRADGKPGYQDNSDPSFY